MESNVSRHFWTIIFRAGRAPKKCILYTELCAYLTIRTPVLHPLNYLRTQNY